MDTVDKIEKQVEDMMQEVGNRSAKIIERTLGFVQNECRGNACLFHITMGHLSKAIPNVLETIETKMNKAEIGLAKGLVESSDIITITEHKEVKQ